ncbi:unnamed protein product [Pedinophyceae sp. YPF-701]|nr:unnamed protein product [Pedinophyceae sp. YPF-701]
MFSASSLVGQRVAMPAAPVRAPRAQRMVVSAGATFGEGVKESRIGKRPIDVPSGVTVTVKDQEVKVKGPKGELFRELRPEVTAEVDGQTLWVRRASNDRKAFAYHGLSRTLCNNMVLGVSEGFKKELKLVGVGYRAAVSGNTINMSLGLSHPVDVEIPEGIKVSVQKNTDVTVEGIDKEAVGTFCAQLKALRPPEPYGGKGIRYADERIMLKEGKKGK